MKFTVQVVVHADDGTETVVRDAFILRREEPLRSETLGLRLAEAQDLLAAVQDALVENQVATATYPVSSILKPNMCSTGSISP